MKSNSIFYKQRFGVEIELTGITRNKAARVIAAHFGNIEAPTHGDDYYDSWYAVDTKARKWRCMSDASLHTETRRNGVLVSASAVYSCEVVTPILEYSDLDDLQEIIRKLRSAGAIANNSCGIHIHVDGANHDAYSLTRLMIVMLGRQDIIYDALENARRSDWCKKCRKPIVDAFKSADKNIDSFKRIWYSNLNDGYNSCERNDAHYNRTRYHGINLHAFYTKGTVEFRLFNGTTHAGKVKAYIQLCLALSAYAIAEGEYHTYINAHFQTTQGMTKEQKLAAMLNFLERRLHMTGKEFATARYHLTAAFRDEVAESEVA